MEGLLTGLEVQRIGVAAGVSFSSLPQSLLLPGVLFGKNCDNLTCFLGAQLTAMHIAPSRQLFVSDDVRVTRECREGQCPRGHP